MNLHAFLHVIVLFLFFVASYSGTAFELVTCLRASPTYPKINHNMTFCVYRFEQMIWTSTLLKVAYMDMFHNINIVTCEGETLAVAGNGSVLDLIWYGIQHFSKLISFTNTFCFGR
ncbi:hypothetical protein ACJX0J_023484 [Zea mays]